MAGTWLSAQTTLAGCGAHDPSLGGRSRGLRGDPVAGHGVAAKPGKVMRVTVASNYRMRDENGQWKEDPHWNEITVFNKARQGYIEEHITKGDLVHVRGRIRQNSYKRADRRLIGRCPPLPNAGKAILAGDLDH